MTAYSLTHEENIRSSKEEINQEREQEKENPFKIVKLGMNTTLDFTELPQEDISPMILRSQAVKKNEVIVT